MTVILPGTVVHSCRKLPKNCSTGIGHDSATSSWTSWRTCSLRLAISMVLAVYIICYGGAVAAGACQKGLIWDFIRQSPPFLNSSECSALSGACASEVRLGKALQSCFAKYDNTVHFAGNLQFQLTWCEACHLSPHLLNRNFRCLQVCCDIFIFNSKHIRLRPLCDILNGLHFGLNQYIC